MVTLLVSLLARLERSPKEFACHVQLGAALIPSGIEHEMVHDQCSAATGQRKALLAIPERSKQQTRRLPFESMSIIFSIRSKRVSARLPSVIHAIQSRRAIGIKLADSRSAFSVVMFIDSLMECSS